MSKSTTKHHQRFSRTSHQPTGSARRAEQLGAQGSDESPIGKSRISFDDDAWSVTVRDVEDMREYSEAVAVVQECKGRVIKQRI